MHNFINQETLPSLSERCVVEETIVGESRGVRKTLQIALYHDRLDGIKAGLRMFPSDKVILLYEAERAGPYAEERVAEYAERVREALGAAVELRPVKSSLLEDVLDVVKDIYVKNSAEYDEILVNLTEGDKILTCSVLSSAFIFGMRAFWTDGQKIYVFPIMRLHYHKALSDAKLAIIRAIQKYGGSVNSLEDLVVATGYDKAQISRHINGAPDSRGLLDLGLVDVERAERGRLSIKLTTPAKILLIGIEAGTKE
jgi:hypothetical protein